jgi:hypothetical protein
MVICIHSNRTGASKTSSAVLVTIAVLDIGHSLAVICVIATTEEQHQRFVTKFVDFIIRDFITY